MYQNRRRTLSRMRLTVDVDLSGFDLNTRAIEGAISNELERTALRIER